MKVPFDRETGHMLSQVPYHKTRVVMKEAPESFQAILKFVDYAKGGSALTLYWQDVMNGVQYCMFISELSNVLLKGNFQEVSGAIVDGRWGFVKKGRSYSIRGIFE